MHNDLQHRHSPAAGDHTMATQPSNPSAFPVNAANFGDAEACTPHPGMSLRDWFAGHAFPLAAETYPELQLTAWFGNRTGLRREEIRAKAAYSYADAMMAESAKNGSVA